MSETQSQASGQVIWHDLMTTDLEASRRFYESFLGWRVLPVQAGNHEYPMIHLGEAGIGGMIALDAAHGLASHWVPYVGTDDVDACVQRAGERGGTAIMAPADIPGVGRFAILRGPEGAVSSPFAYTAGPLARPSMTTPGAFCWEELLSKDPAAAQRYYSEVYGWTFQEVDMGPMGTYRLAHAGETMIGGILEMPAEAPGPEAFLAYVTVADVDAQAERARELGARVCVPPGDIPGTGRFSVLQDPQGASFAIFARPAAG